MKSRWGLALTGILVAGFVAAAQADDGRGRRGYPLGTPRHSPQGQLYLMLHGGVFAPNSESDGLDGYDSGWNFNAGIGSRLSAVFAVEAMAGVYGAERDDDKVSVIPVTIGGRFIIPGAFLEPYLGGGIGFYVADLEEAPREPDFSGIDDSKTTVGGYLSIGLDAWMTPRTALSFEGAYQFASASFKSHAGNEFDVDLSGWTVNLGIRYEF